MPIDRYIKKFDDYSYEISVSQLPYERNIEIYRGDEISITIRGVNLDANKTPFNFDIFDEFNWCFRAWEDDTKQYCADSSNIILGQSGDAISYDQNQGNPPQTTQDEIHLVDDNYEILSDYNNDEVFFDVEGIITDSTVQTFMKFKANIKKDISR